MNELYSTYFTNCIYEEKTHELNKFHYCNEHEDQLNVCLTLFCDFARSDGSTPLTAPITDVASLPSRDAADDDTLPAGE